MNFYHSIDDDDIDVGPYDISEVSDDFFSELDVPASKVSHSKHERTIFHRLWTKNLSIPFPEGSDLEEFREEIYNEEYSTAVVITVKDPKDPGFIRYRMFISAFATPFIRENKPSSWDEDDSENPLPWGKSTREAMMTQFIDNDGLKSKIINTPWGESIFASAGNIETGEQGQKLLIMGYRGTNWTVRATVESFHFDDSVYEDACRMMQDIVVFRNKDLRAPGTPLDVTFIDRRAKNS